MFEERIIRFMRLRKPIAIVSLVFVLVALGSFFTRGLNLGQDFTGGTSAEINYLKSVDQDAVLAALHKAGFHDAIVQHLDRASDVLVRMPVQKGHETSISADLLKAVNFDAANPAVVKQVDSVGSQVGDELYQQSVLAVVISLFLMMVYVAFRFRFKFAVGAVVSLAHDVIITVGIFSIFGWPFDLTVLAAVLALIGYSLNDTIVVFDRIRENFRKLRKYTAEEVVDLSLTETLRRTVMTVSTVILVVLALLFLGGPALKWFSVALLIGLLVGTYSSIYIATSYALAMGLSKEDFVIPVKTEEDDRP
ncbi:MAG: protein translocase subunit SecF [bacterium]|nr:protein translocase subunit SecF [bacterium]